MMDELQSGTQSGTWHINVEKADHAAVSDAIRAEVTGDGVLRLYPDNVLGAMFLERFGLHGDIKNTWSYRQCNDGHRLLHVELRSEAAPLLSSGGDPYYHGSALSREEHEACRALLDKMRGRDPMDALEPLGGGWYELPDCRKVQGRDNALAALKEA